MRIGFFTDTYLPQLDGVVVSIRAFREELIRQGHEVYVFAIDTRSKAKEGGMEVNYSQLEVTEDNVYRFKSMRPLFVPGYPLALPISAALFRKIPRLKLDVVHCHTPLMLGMLGDMVALVKKVPLVYTYHTYYPEYVKHYVPVGQRFTPKMVQKYDVFYCNRANRVIAPSEKLKKVLLSYGVESDISILPTGVDLAKFAAAVGNDFRAKYGVGAKERMLVSVARMNTEKNIPFLLKSMAELKIRRGEDCPKLFLIGGGKGKDDFEAMAADLGVADQVVFTGPVEQTEVLSALKASTMMVFSSKTDTQGLVLLEAAASGRPVVMIRDDGLGRVVRNGENGLVVSESILEFVAAVEQLLNDEALCARMGAKSEEIAAELSIDQQTKKLVQIYEEVIAEKSSLSWRRRLRERFNQEVAFQDLWQKGRKIFKGKF